MRQLIRTYAITGLHEITITDYTFTKQDIRLIINESLASAATTTENLVASVLVSSTKKDNVVNVLNGVITLANTTANLTVGDELTIEIDIDNIAKTSDIPTINLIQNGLATSQNVSDASSTIVNAIPTVNEILNGLAKTTDLGTVLTRMGQAPVGSTKSTLFAYLSSIWNSMEGQQQEELPEGLADRVALLLQFFGIAGSFEAEGVGHEQTDNTVINECKTRYAEVFGDLLPSDFVMPNSVTIDGTTYTGTVS